ncbi:MAG: transglycosylase SLT domain-containing protein [Bacteriovoracaceae bacterium]|nr:transglycosylase SLT domain-containing protein [Bacteriovoracaceae bacterium]
MSLISRPPTMKMAPPGSHIVAKQARISPNGIKYFVKAHIRKNRGKKIVLLPENILYLFWHGDQDYPAIGSVKGYPEYSELDAVIQFWMNYWQDFGLPFPKGLDPLIIKVMIAVESSFRPKVGSKESSAYGLMQITNTTRRDAKNINDGILDLERKDLEDPVINISMGVRWLSYKFSSIEKGEKKDLFNTLKYYYDKHKGDDYANKVLKLYHVSVNPKS